MTNLAIVAMWLRNSGIDRWLDEHPAVLGGVFILLGLGVGGYGAYEVATGVARDKWGNQVQGGMGKALGFIRLGGGVLCLGFGLFKLLFG